MMTHTDDSCSDVVTYTIWSTLQSASCTRTAWEAGHREVGVISWPGKVKAGAVTHVLASALDFVPTVLELAGVPLPTDRVFDGKDLGHVIFSDDPGAASVDAHHKFLFHSVGGQAYVASTLVVLG